MPNPQPTPTIAEEVVITAVGVVSPLGVDYQQNLASLKAGRDCASPVERFDVSQCRCQTAAQIPDAWLAHSQDSRHRLHRASRMCIAALRELVANDPGARPELLVVGTTSGGMTFGEEFYRSLKDRSPSRHGATLLANYQPQKMIHDALSAVGFRAPSQILANACASGTNAIGHAFNLVRNRIHQRVICGGFDAISEMVYVGFDSLQASTPGKCSPFDLNRSGLILGEGAAFLSLESSASARERGAPILARITGYGISTDNHHLTQPNPTGVGPRMAMERALACAGRQTVDYINAHGTATAFNDSTEALAILELGLGSVPVSSTKSMMGHSLGAAGAIEAVISLMAIREQFLPPNINFTEPELALNIVANQSRPARVQSVLSNSFGFGGTNAALLLEQL